MNWIPILQPERYTIEPDIDPQRILVNPECQPRKDGTDADRVTEYALEMKSRDPLGWRSFPKIRCVKDEKGVYHLYSGFHRLEAILRNGYETIEIEYVDGTYTDAVVLSKCENADHGVRRTNADKEHIVMSCLQDTELRRWSNEQIAKWCAVDPKTVANYEARLSGKSREDGDEPYTRPAVRLFLKKDGTIGEKDTREIGKRERTVSDENQLTLDADIQGQALAKLTEARSAFRMACNKFEALPALGHLPEGYTLRRVRSLVGITNEDPRDWGVEYINIQASLCSESAKVIDRDANGYKDPDVQETLNKLAQLRNRFRDKWKKEQEEWGLPPDPKLDEQSLEELLREIRLVAETRELFTVLRPPHLQFPLDERTAPAIAEVDAILTADWEAKSHDKRIEYLQRLIKLQPVLYKLECELRDASEKERLKIQLDEARAETWELVDQFQKTFMLSDLQLPLSEFLLIVAEHFNYDAKILNFLVSDDPKSKKRRRELSLKELRTWKSRLNTLITAIKQKAEAFAHLRPRPKECLKELKGHLHRQGTPVFEVMVEATWLDRYKLTASGFAKLKVQAIADGCEYYREQNMEIRKQVAAIYIEDKEISASDLTLTDIESRAIEVYDNLTPETFSGTHDKEDFNDYDLLVKEHTALTAYVEAVRNKHDWLRALLPKDVDASAECFVEMQEHFEQKQTFDNLDFLKVANLFKCDLETVYKNAQTVREKALKSKQKYHTTLKQDIVEEFNAADLKDVMPYEIFQDAARARYGLRRDIFTMNCEGIGYRELCTECEALSDIATDIHEGSYWVHELKELHASEEFRYRHLTGVTLWYNARQPVPNDKPLEVSTYMEWGHAMEVVPDRPLKTLTTETRRTLETMLQSGGMDSNELLDEPNWSWLRYLAGEILTELGEPSPEEAAQIQELTAAIDAILDEYTTLSRTAKLWVLAQIAWDLMGEMEGQIENPIEQRVQGDVASA